MLPQLTNKKISVAVASAVALSGLLLLLPAEQHRLISPGLDRYDAHRPLFAEHVHQQVIHPHGPLQQTGFILANLRHADTPPDVLVRAYDHDTKELLAQSTIAGTAITDDQFVYATFQPPVAASSDAIRLELTAPTASSNTAIGVRIHPDSHPDWPRYEDEKPAPGIMALALQERIPLWRALLTRLRQAHAAWQADGLPALVPAPALHLLGYSATTAFGLGQGLLIGIALALATVGLTRLPTRRQTPAALVLLSCLPLLLLTGLWYSPHPYAISDWDYHLAHDTGLRRLLLTQGTLPTWDPYICGGTAALADPEFSMLSPVFLFELLFDVTRGLKLGVFFAFAVHSIGVFMLARRLRLSVLAALIAALGATYNGFYLLHLVEGHLPIVLPAMWLPWVLWAWITAYKRPSVFYWPLVAGIFLALMFYQGGIYPLFYTGLVLAGVSLLTHNRRRALVTTLTAAAWAAGLAAFKLIPTLYWVRQFQDTSSATSAVTLPWLHHILLGRYYHGTAPLIPGQGGGWHEYGAYVGPVLLALSLAAVFFIRRPLVRGLAIATAVALVVSASGPLLAPLFDTLPWLPSSNISRLVILAVLGLSLLAGVTIHALEQRRRWRWVPLLAAVLVLDLATYAYPHSNHIFTLPAVHPAPPPAQPPVEFTIDQHKYRLEGTDYARATVRAQAGYGTLAYCSPLSPQPAVTVQEQIDKPNTFAIVHPQSAGTVSLESWTPSRVMLAADLAEAAAVSLNTNYARGWRVTLPATKPKQQSAEPIERRVGVQLPAGRHTIIFSYHPPGRATGLAVSALTVTAAALLITRRRQ